MDRPGARVPAGIDGIEGEAGGLVEEEERGFEEAVGEEREELSVLGEHQLAGGGGGAALRSVLGEDGFHGFLEVGADVGETRGVELDGGGAGEGESDGDAVQAFEETGIGGGDLETLVENAETTVARIGCIGGVKELNE